MAADEDPHLPDSYGAEGDRSNIPELMVSDESSTHPLEPSSQLDCTGSNALPADNVDGIKSVAKQGQSDPSPHNLQPDPQSELQSDIKPSTVSSAGATQNNEESVFDSSVAKKRSPTGSKDVQGNLNDAVHYLAAIEKRSGDLEDKPEKPKAKPDGIDEFSKDKKRRVTIPEIKRVNWYHHKNISLGSKPCAIEVLMGPAKYYQTKATEQRKNRREKQLGISPPNWDAGVLEGKPDPLMTRSVPERVRIWSIPVLLILDEIDNYPLDRIPTHVDTYLRPFKLFLRLREGINSNIETLEAKWGAIDQASRSPSSTSKDQPQDVQHATPDSNASSIPFDGNVAESFRTEFSSTDAGKRSEEAIRLPTTESSDIKVEGKPSESVYDIMDSVEALQDLRCLKKFIDEDVIQVVDRYRNNVDCKIRFHDLWYLFQPGDEVVALAKQQMEPSKATSKTQNALRAYQTAYKVYSTVGGRHNLSDKDSDDSDSENEDLFDGEPAEGQSGKSRPNPFIIRCYYIDYDGTSYFPATHDFHITPFDGERDITSLDVFPARFLPNYDSFRQNLIERGRKFVELLDAKHMRYNGPEHVCLPCGCAHEYSNGKPVFNQPRSFTGEVIVDFREALRVDDFWMPERDMYRLYPNMRETSEAWGIDFSEDPAGNLYTKPEEMLRYDHSDDAELIKKAVENSKFLREYNQHKVGVSMTQMLDEEDLMLLPSRVMGYVLRERAFAPLDLKYLSNVSADPKGFDDLELPAGHKEMVKALVKEHFQSKSSESTQQDYDIIAGKGRGLIILLHGVPGVGKTSTAECVAAFTGRPLFPITCGDLGTTATSVEYSLSNKFHLASTWNCVLLLDEADIFLAQRDRQNLERNAIVSGIQLVRRHAQTALTDNKLVFLRVLEYYDGILFLTTNRVGTFDEAFKSRIHVSLYYPELEEGQTLQIWKKNLARIQKIDAARAQQLGRPTIQIKEAKILEYARKHFVESKAFGRWNGRQIRNAFQTAAALAVYQTNESGKIPSLGVTHFRTVTKATREFDRYLNETMGSDETRRAWKREERASSFTPEASTSHGLSPNHDPSSQTQQQYSQQHFPQQNYAQQRYGQQQYSQQPYNPQHFSQPQFGSPNYQQPQVYLQQDGPVPVTPHKNQPHHQQPEMSQQTPQMQPFQAQNTPTATTGEDMSDSSDED